MRTNYDILNGRHRTQTDVVHNLESELATAKLLAQPLPTAPTNTQNLPPPGTHLDPSQLSFFQSLTQHAPSLIPTYAQALTSPRPQSPPSPPPGFRPGTNTTTQGPTHTFTQTQSYIPQLNTEPPTANNPQTTPYPILFGPLTQTQAPFTNQPAQQTTFQQIPTQNPWNTTTQPTQAISPLRYTDNLPPPPIPQRPPTDAEQREIETMSRRLQDILHRQTQPPPHPEDNPPWHIPQEPPNRQTPISPIGTRPPRNPSIYRDIPKTVKSIKQMMNKFKTGGTVTIIDHIQRYEHVMDTLRLTSQEDLGTFLPWTFEDGLQPFFIENPSSEFSTWQEYKNEVISNFSAFRNKHEALKAAISMTCQPNQNPRDFFHQLKLAFAHTNPMVNTESPEFKRSFFYGLPETTIAHMAGYYREGKSCKWLLDHAKSIYDVSRATPITKNTNKNSEPKKVAEISNPKEHLQFESGRPTRNIDNRDHQQEQQTNPQNTERRNPPFLGKGKELGVDFYVSPGYVGSKPIKDFAPRQQDRQNNPQTEDRRQYNQQTQQQGNYQPRDNRTDPNQQQAQQQGNYQRQNYNPQYQQNRNYQQNQGQNPNEPRPPSYSQKNDARFDRFEHQTNNQLEQMQKVIKELLQIKQQTNQTGPQQDTNA